METEKDKALWLVAKKRVKFKRHLVVYIIMNLFFWVLWYFTDKNETESHIPWPIFPLLGWGIGLVFNFLDAYINNHHDAIEKEFNKLKNK